MDITQIETFLCIAKLGSFSHASAVLHITQPAVSKRIQALELALGYKLFKRNAGKVELTEQGRRFIIYANNLLATWQSAKQDIHSKLSHDLLIGATSLNSYYVLPLFLPKFLEKYPEYKVCLKVEHSDLLSEMVKSGEVDAALSNLFLDSSGVSMIKIGDYKIVPVVNSKFLKRVRTKVLNGEGVAIFYFWGKGAEPQNLFHGLLEARGIKPSQIIQGNTAEAVKRLLVESPTPAIAFLPKLTVLQELRSQTFVEIDLNINIPHYPVLLIHASKNHSPALQKFISFVQSYHESIELLKVAQ